LKRFWIPLNIGDYLAETAHLKVAEHGAYVLLLMYYWIHSGLPKDEEAIRRISRMTPRQWSQSGDVIRALFKEEWRHPVMDLEIRKAIEKSKANSANAHKSHTSRRRFASQQHLQSPHNIHIQPESLPSGESSLPTRLDPNWKPNEVEVSFATGRGMSSVDVANELSAFRAYHAERNTLSHDWSATWLKWCLRWNGKSKAMRTPTDREQIVTTKIHIKMDTAQWEAWQAYKKRVTGKGTPYDKEFGWYFESEWPPDHLISAGEGAP
jgi:uncharacterized protein YdaU (DUF1376 family)